MKIKVLILFFLALRIFPQSADFNVRSFVIKDELKSSDPVEENLGRFNNFEIHLNSGDKVAIDFQSENFTPLIVFVSPEGKKQVYYPKNGKTIKFTQNINESGNWNLFIIGGKDDFGKYVCRVSFADSNAVKIQPLKNLCELLKYFSAHAEARFVFVKDFADKLKSLYEKPEAKITSVKFDEENNSNLTLDVKNSAQAFENISDALYECFEDWNIKESKRRNKDGNKIKTITAIESNVKTPRIIKISTVDSNGNNKLILKFGVLE